MSKVVTTYKNCSPRFLVIFRQYVFQHILTCRVKEVEGFVKYYQLWFVQQGRDYSHLMFISCREVSDKFLLSQNLSSHKVFKVGKSLVNLFLLHSVYFSYEIEELLRCKELYEETFVDICSCLLFPALVLRRVDVVNSHLSFVGFEQVEYQSEKCSLAGTVVTDKTKYISRVDGEVVYVNSHLLTEAFL